MTDHSCWTCDAQQRGGTTFVGKCWWFVSASKDQFPRDIPFHVVDKGCQHWTERLKPGPPSPIEGVETDAH